jgi:predicted SnoaL-like aldol condensation-catalyzing enzyme
MSIEKNKATALEFYRLAEVGDLGTWASKAMHPDFASYHMGHTYPPGRDGWVSFVTEHVLPTLSKNTQLDIRRIVAEGNEVWVWAAVKGFAGPDRESVDILIFDEEGRLKEKWDVQQVGLYEYPGPTSSKA